MEKRQHQRKQQPLLFQAYPLGESAVVLEFGDSISPEIQAKIRSFARVLEGQQSFPGLIEWVPAYTTLTIYYDPWLLSEAGRHDPYPRLLEQLNTLAAGTLSTTVSASRLVEIPVCYDEAYGPDLAYVCSHTGLSSQEIIRLHTEAEYLVYMIGFAPGFPYLGGMDKRLTSPRREKPRSRIPAGSVGIAGEQTGVYPLETPGGWQLIGRTPLQLFRPHASQPSLLQAGDRVRFMPISPLDFQQILEDNR